MLICPRLPCFLRGEGKNTASPCRKISHAMRLEGCKEFLLVASVTSVIFCQNSTNLTYTPQILHFDVPSSKELTLGLPQINLGILSLNRSFVFLYFCVFVKPSVCAYNIYNNQ